MAAERSTAQIAWQGSVQVRRFQEEMARRRSEEARRIGANITTLRERHHLTQEAAAAKLKVAYRTYQSWEQGTSVPRWPTRERIAKFYRVPIEEVNGPPTPGSAGLQLAQIEAQVNDLHVLFFGDGAGEAGIAARLLQADESPPPPVDEQSENPSADAPPGPA